MTFEQIWNQLLTKNSKLAVPETQLEMKAGNLQRLLRQVYEQGVAAGELDPANSDPLSAFKAALKNRASGF